MSAYDVAQQLALELRNSEEYQSFIGAKERIKANENNYKVIRDFQLKQFEIQQAQLFQLEVDTDKQQELERLYSLLSLNPEARQYLEAEFRVSRLVNDVQKIIGDAILEALPIGFEEQDDFHPVA